jgi:predicted nucleic acid-binding protein
MKAILIDTNIVLDIALERRDFYEKAKELIEISYLNSISSFVTASSITDIYYLLKKKKGHLHTINFLKIFFS